VTANRETTTSRGRRVLIDEQAFFDWVRAQQNDVRVGGA